MGATLLYIGGIGLYEAKGGIAERNDDADEEEGKDVKSQSFPSPPATTSTPFPQSGYSFVAIFLNGLLLGTSIDGMVIRGNPFYLSTFLLIHFH